MHVLQAAVAIVRRGDAEKLFVERLGIYPIMRNPRKVSR